jgi:hypothetical protein
VCVCSPPPLPFPISFFFIFKNVFLLFVGVFLSSFLCTLRLPRSNGGDVVCSSSPLFFCVLVMNTQPRCLSPPFFFFVLPPDGLRGETCCEAELMSTLNVLSLSLLPLYSWGGREWRGATWGYFCYSHTQEKGNRINNNNPKKKKKAFTQTTQRRELEAGGKENNGG